MENEEKKRDTGQQLYISILLAIIAIMSATMATVAWFSIADNTKVQSLNMEITSGTWLKFDLYAHSKIQDYSKTLTFADIAAHIENELGFDLQKVPLEPVTTKDCNVFTFHDGKVVEASSGAYLEFTLHFFATQDMIVHLTSADSKEGALGTAVSSENKKMPNAMRISFTIGDEVRVYDPGQVPGSFVEEDIKYIGLPQKEDMKYSDDTSLFFIKAYEDLPVVVHVWMEGNDEACDDELRGTDYSIRLRFQGTNDEFVPFEDGER